MMTITVHDDANLADIAYVEVRHPQDVMFTRDCNGLHLVLEDVCYHLTPSVEDAAWTVEAVGAMAEALAICVQDPGIDDMSAQRHVNALQRTLQRVKEAIRELRLRLPEPAVAGQNVREVA